MAADRWMWEDLLDRISYGDVPHHGDVCWIWRGRLDGDGYGWLPGRYGARDTAGPLVHRYAYTVQVGRIPAGKVLDHLCRTRSCCNPAHLVAVTNRENLTAPGSLSVAYGNLGLKTHCHRGHEFTPENTYVAKSGSRICRTCQAEHSRLYQQRRRSRERATR